MQDIGGSSIGAAIDRMRSAYARRDTEAFLCAYERAAAESHSLRAAIRLLERVYPLESFLRLAHRLNWNLAERGLHEGCRAFLDEASLPWERVLPASCQAIAESGPVVFYGNHRRDVEAFCQLYGINVVHSPRTHEERMKSAS